MKTNVTDIQVRRWFNGDDNVTALLIRLDGGVEISPFLHTQGDFIRFYQALAGSGPQAMFYDLCYHILADKNHLRVFHITDVHRECFQGTLHTCIFPAGPFVERLMTLPVYVEGEGLHNWDTFTFTEEMRWDYRTRLRVEVTPRARALLAQARQDPERWEQLRAHIKRLSHTARSYLETAYGKIFFVLFQDPDLQESFGWRILRGTEQYDAGGIVWDEDDQIYRVHR